MANHSSIPAWRIPWTEEPGGLQSMESPRVRHDWATNTLLTYRYYYSAPTKEIQRTPASSGLRPQSRTPLQAPGLMPTRPLLCHLTSPSTCPRPSPGATWSVAPFQSTPRASNHPLASPGPRGHCHPMSSWFSPKQTCPSPGDLGQVTSVALGFSVDATPFLSLLRASGHGIKVVVSLQTPKCKSAFLTRLCCTVSAKFIHLSEPPSLPFSQGSPNLTKVL